MIKINLLKFALSSLFFFICIFPSIGAECARQNTPKYVYLTFDDGPLKGSDKINSIVLAEQIKINVFIIGKTVANDEHLRNFFALYEKNPYIETYNHSYSHANGEQYTAYYKDPQGVLQDVIKNQDFLKLKYKIVRLPGGNIWRIGKYKKDIIKECAKAADLLATQGYYVFGWDLEWQHDSKTAKPVQSVAELTQQIDTLFANKKLFMPDHLVLLIHDEMFEKEWEGSELKQLIENLKKKGYILEHLRNYPNVSAP